MKNRHSPRQQNGRGRPRLPFRETVPGRIYAQLGSLISIRQRLKYGGETGHDLLQSVGLNPERFSNERVSQIVGTIFKHKGKRSPLPRSHPPQWRVVRFLKHFSLNLQNGFQNNREIGYLSRQLTSKRWVNQAVKRTGSFRQLLEELGIPRAAEKRLRQLLLESGIPLPHKKKPAVTLRCRICHRKFIRSLSYERRFGYKRKRGPLCGIKHS